MIAKLRNVFKIKDAKSGSSGPIIKDGHLQFNIISISRHFIGNLPILIFSAFVCMVISGVILYLVPEKYCSHASILPSGKGDDLSVLKEMAGLSGLGSENNENSSVLYPKILSSRQLKEAVINYNYSTSCPTQKETTLKEYFGTSINEHLLNKLNKITSIDSDSKTGLITISVETEYPELSQAIVQRYLAELEDYNINRRKSSASERVKYLKRESAERETELMQAEDDLEQFQMANRNWNMTSDPGILAELNRKKREIMAKSETYLFLKNQYDLAKLEAQKDIPIVRILDNPSLPLVKAGPPRLILILLFGFIGMISTAIYILIRTTIKNTRKITNENIEMPTTNRQTSLTVEEISQ